MDTKTRHLNPEERRFYARHLVLPEVGIEGQERLKAASAVIVGAGGLGSPAALYLAAAGVGRLGLVDFDTVDESNLHRQVLYGVHDVGRPKLAVAANRLRALNPHIQVDTIDERLTGANALEILRPYDVVLDGTDNFATRYLVNDACVLLGKRNVYGSIFQFEGQVSIFGGEGPCYRCLFPEPPPAGSVPNCAEAGVFGVLPGIIGSLQAAEAIKLILGIGETLSGAMLSFDVLNGEVRKFEVRRDPSCPLCGDDPTIHALLDYESFCGRQSATPEISVEELHERIAKGRDFILLDVREEHELRISRLDPHVHIPMDEVEERADELDPSKEILVLCRTGRRSAHITDLLRDRGFKDVKNVAGGINAYAEKLAPELETY